MAKKKTIFDLGKREREILEAVLKLGEVSVNDVLAELREPPSYSTVRAILGQLVRKGNLTFRDDRGRYLYKALTTKESAQKSALKDLVSTIFYGKASDVIVTLLDLAGNTLTPEEIDRINNKISQQNIHHGDSSTDLTDVTDKRIKKHLR
ncbi:MAG: BlaI/MecI/CopY family transcriptional regulator [Planctomycetaceae bacterium]|nr:BlaI/MecI/CopY family transcriptional regulator [Planctomycetaceae bacterium]